MPGGPGETVWGEGGVGLPPEASRSSGPPLPPRSFREVVLLPRSLPRPGRRGASGLPIARAGALVTAAAPARMGFRPPLTLQGRWVALVPLSTEHVPGLVEVGTDPEIWTFMRTGHRETPAGMEELVRTLLGQQEEGTDLPFTIFYRPQGRVAGMTRFLDIRREDRGVEIGGTWLDPRLWRTPVNTEAKYLLLRHAFETEGCLRVQLKTDARNARSQRAIERLGAQKEGVLRKQFVLADGHVRDSVYYSILDDEWPAVKQRLEGFLEKDWRSSAGAAAGAPR